MAPVATSATQKFIFFALFDSNGFYYVPRPYPFAAFDCRLVHSKNLPEAIDHFIQENDIDVLALTTHRRNILTRIFNPGIARKLVLHSKTPILVFHE